MVLRSMPAGAVRRGTLERRPIFQKRGQERGEGKRDTAGAVDEREESRSSMGEVSPHPSTFDRGIV